jgi:hypothetical protein
MKRRKKGVSIGSGVGRIEKETVTRIPRGSRENDKQIFRRARKLLRIQDRSIKRAGRILKRDRDTDFSENFSVPFRFFNCPTDFKSRPKIVAV